MIHVYNPIKSNLTISICCPYILAEMPEDEEVSLMAVIIPKEIKNYRNQL